MFLSILFHPFLSLYINVESLFTALAFYSLDLRLQEPGSPYISQT